MLQDLQGNILKGHGRHHTENLFLRFDRASAEDARAFLRALAPSITSAHEQLQDAQAFSRARANPAVGNVSDAKIFVAVVLSAAGYRALGVEDSRIPQDRAFRAGQKSRAAGLGDPQVDTWEQPFREEIHAMVLLAGPSESAVRTHRARLMSRTPATVTIVHIEPGRALHNAVGNGIEHFGYVDGRSQPIFLNEDIAKEPGRAKWDPAFPLKQVLVPCPGGPPETAFGSYFVFRKLEQDVKGFKEREEQLADALGLTGEDRERAGAMAVGRFEDGTPVVLQATDGAPSLPSVINDFNYRDDPSGSRCPFHSHIRKTNPRGESGPPTERDHIMARRGIPYGERDAERDAGGRITRFNDAPSGGVGLLFMAYQSDIAQQFEFTQRAWSNNPSFVKPGTGLDPLTGQGPAADQSWPERWGEAGRRPFSFSGFVSMRGGEYFFAPCISFFRSI